MEAWVIKRDDGKYFAQTEIPKFCTFTEKIVLAVIYTEEFQAEYYINNCNLQNCKPVKIKICEVEEDE